MSGRTHRMLGGLKAISRPNAMLLGVSFVLIVGICALFVVDLAARHRAAIEDTKRSALSFADVLAEHTARTFEAIELTLRAADTVRRSTEPPMAVSMETVRKSLQGLQSSSPALLALEWTNSKGDVIAHSSLPAGARSNVADVPHFQALRDSKQDGLFVGPLFRSAASGQLISAAALRISDDNGDFAGIVAAPLNLSYFSRTFRAVQLGDNDSVALMRQDGTLLTREPYVEGAVGKSFLQLPLFSERVPVAQSGTFEATSPIDGTERIYGFRVVPGLPLIILVTQSRAEALAAWHRHIRTFGPLVILLVLIILVGTSLLSHKTRQHLKQTALLEATLENMHEGLIVVDKANRIAIFNRRALGLLDLPTEFMKTRPTSPEVIAFQTNAGEFAHNPPQTLSRIEPVFGEKSEYTYERQRPNGALLEIRTVPFTDGGVVRTYKDITLQRQMEIELSRNARQFRILAEHATDIIARLDFKGMMLYVSPSCEHVLGYSPAELSGATITDYIHPDEVASILASFEQVASGTLRADSRIEYRFRHKSGNWLWLEANPTAVFDDAGHPCELVDVVRDITDRKLMEAEALAARAEAEQAAIAKGEFLASMSHELRTPLNSIIGFSNLILDRADLEPDIRRQVGLIQTASDSLLSIVNDVLDFSKIEEGKLAISAAIFNVTDLVEGSVAIIKGIADIKRLDMRVLIDPLLPREVIGDDQRIRQVLLNLLNNAVKFTRAGSVQLTVAPCDTKASPPRIKFAVTDTGIGIAPNKQDRLFQRFSQVDGSITREFGGSGLGLAICKRLVDLMGGEIGFESAAGTGSTFWFEVPLPAHQTTAAAKTEVRGPDGAGSGRRILLVEDLDVNREIALAIIKRAGYEVDAVPDGVDAIAAIKSQHYDVVLMDVQMPGMDGVTATRIVRALPSPACDVPIVAMTANVLPEQIEGFRAAGMNGHIGKPFKPERLIAAIEEQIGDSHVPRPESSATSEPSAIEHLKTLMPGEQLDSLLTMLVKRLEHFSSQIRTTDRSELREEAHRLTSSAGLFGFRQLSEACAQLDIAIADDQEIEPLIEMARQHSVAALTQLKAMTIAAGGTGRKQNRNL